MPKFFDCNCQVGRWGTPQPEHFTDAKGMVDELSYHGIGEALAFHAFAKEISPSLGNERLMDEISGHPLHPCWVVLPHHTGEMAEPQELVDTMLSRGVRAARMFPTFHSYRMTPWCCGELLAEFERRRIPTFVELDQTSWDDIASTLAAFPKLRLTLVRVGYRCDRILYPLFEKYPNFSLEISFYQPNSAIQTVCRRFGADRLLFGTALPFYAAGVPISMINYAEISDQEKQMIAGDNLRRLLREVEE